MRCLLKLSLSINCLDKRCQVLLRRFISVSNAARKLVLADKYGAVKVYAAMVRNSGTLSKVSESLTANRVPFLVYRCGGNSMLVAPARSFQTGNGALYAEAPKAKASGSGGKKGGWTPKDYLILGSGVAFVVLLTAPISGMDYKNADHTGHVTPSFSFTQFAFLMFMWLVLCVAIERGMHHQRFMTKQLKRGADQASKSGGFSLKL